MTNHKGAIPVYFTSLELKNVRCFGERQQLDLTDEVGKPARWTLILGENGTGKTTLLQCLAWMSPTSEPKRTTVPVDEKTDKSTPLLVSPIRPGLSAEQNDVLEKLLRVGREQHLDLRAELCQGENFRSINNQNRGELLEQTVKKIRTGIKLLYSPKRELKDIDLRTGNTIIRQGAKYYEPFIIAYGANRQLGSQNLSLSELDDPIASRLSGVTELYDAEEILNDLDHAARIKKAGSDERKRLKEVKQLLAKILPGIQKPNAIKVLPPNIFGDTTEPSGVCFETFSGLVPLSALSFGYQTTLAWTVDLALRLFRRYPKSSNPLAEPAIVLIDEIDLHLHPLWQLTIIDDLTSIFRRTQFIATAHSPLIVQVASSANLVVVGKGKNQVEIHNDPTVVRNWRVDQILTSQLFGVPSARPKQFQQLFQQRDKLLHKSKRTAADEARLQQLEEEIMNWPTASDPKDQEAMDIIRDAAAILKKYKGHKR